MAVTIAIVAVAFLFTGRENTFSDDHIDLRPNQFRGHVTEPVGASTREAELDSNVQAFHIPLVAESLTKGLERGGRYSH
jgi:hypothetical protein